MITANNSTAAGQPVTAEHTTYNQIAVAQGETK